MLFQFVRGFTFPLDNIASFFVVIIELLISRWYANKRDAWFASVVAVGSTGIVLRVSSAACAATSSMALNAYDPEKLHIYLLFVPKRYISR